MQNFRQTIFATKAAGRREFSCLSAFSQAGAMGGMDQDRMELGSLEEDTGSYNKREQKRRKKKKISSCGPTAFQVKRDIAAFSREKNVFTHSESILFYLCITKIRESKIILVQHSTCAYLKM